MAKKEQYTFQSADGVTAIHGVRWLPDHGSVKAVLNITHGMVEYIERYGEFAGWLTDRGYAVYGHDHIGHGDSVQSPKEWGIMHAKHPADVMTADMLQDVRLGKQLWPDVPFYMLGHSMGSYLLRMFLARYAAEYARGNSSDIQGAVIMGTGTVPDGTIRFGLFLLQVLALFHGWEYKSPFTAGLMYGKPYKKYNLDGTEPENSWLSKNVENVRHYYQDPKCTFQFSLGAYRGLLEACLYDNQVENIELIPKDLPVLFVSGMNDPVGDLGEGVKAAYLKFKKAGMQDAAIRLFNNDRHEILNETDRENVYEVLLSWMQERA